jgi:hypothetical protein
MAIFSHLLWVTAEQSGGMNMREARRPTKKSAEAVAVRWIDGLGIIYGYVFFKIILFLWGALLPFLLMDLIYYEIQHYKSKKTKNNREN